MPTKFQKILTLFAVSMALGSMIIDTTVLNVSISNIISDLGASVTDIQWAVTAYSLVMAALMIPGGKLGDIFGRKRMFVIGNVLFTLGAIISSQSQTIHQLLLGWSFIEGIGAAMMMPATMALLVSTFEGKSRAMAFGIWGAVAGASAAIGPIIGGYLTDNFSWRYAFYLDVAMALLVFFASFGIKEFQVKSLSNKLDFPGILFSGLGFSSIIFGLVKASGYGWFKAKKIFEIGSFHFDLGYFSITPFFVILGFIFLAIFVYIELQRTKKDQVTLVTLSIFKNMPFISGLVTFSAFAAAQAGIIFTLPVFFQGVLGYTAFETGKAFLPLSITSFFFAPFSAYLSKWIDPKRIIQLGILTSGLSAILMRYGMSANPDEVLLWPALAVFGIGMGMVMSQISNLTLSAVKKQESGEASGINSTMRTMGNALGSAIIGSVFIAAMSTVFAAKIESNTTIPEDTKPQIIKNIDQMTETMGLGEDNSLMQINEDEFQDLSPIEKKAVEEMFTRVGTEMKTISAESIVEGNQKALLWIVGLFALNFTISFWLPKRAKKQNSVS